MEKKEVKCKYSSKIFNEGIFRFKHHLSRTIYDSEPSVSVPEEIKVLVMKVVSDSKDVSTQKRIMNKLMMVKKVDRVLALARYLNKIYLRCSSYSESTIQERW